MADFVPPDWKKLLPETLTGPVSARAFLADQELYAPKNIGRWAREAQARLERQANDSEKEALALHKSRVFGSPIPVAMKAEEQRRAAMAIRFWQLHGCPDTPHTLLVPVPKKLRKGRFK